MTEDLSGNIKKLISNFGKRNIKAFYFEDIEKVKEYILNAIPGDAIVGVGHSLTLQEMNIVNILRNRGNAVLDKESAKDKEECKRIKKKALLADFYISGSNAVSIDGRIVNVDHSGNRVAAITFGPDKVIIVVGVNKITENLNEAIKRVKNTACYKNAERAGFNPPCVKLHRCVDCVSEERVCNTLSIIEGQKDKDRLELIIVNEELGY